MCSNHCQSARYPAKNGPNSLLVNVDIPIHTKRLVRISLYPSKIDLVFLRGTQDILGIFMRYCGWLRNPAPLGMVENPTK